MAKAGEKIRTESYPEGSIPAGVSAPRRDTLWLTGMSRPSKFFDIKT
jgi:hypothetical protein